MGWRWYPLNTVDEPRNSWIETGMNKEDNETIISFDSFDSRRTEIYYELTKENNYNMAMRFDLLISRAKRYFWRDIALVIRNVPTLPYV
jgi:hypothetical protein